MANFFGPLGQLASAGWTTACVAGTTAVTTAEVIQQVAPHVNRMVRHSGNILVSGANVAANQTEKLDLEAREWSSRSDAELIAWKAAKGIK